MTTATVFPDTTILIQYDALDHIDWKGIFGIESVKLVLAPSVIQELDDIKNQNISSNLAQRAKETIDTIERLKVEQESASIISTILLAEEPDIDFFAEGLDYTSVADLLVASIIDYQGSFALDYIILLTEDKQTKLKALAAGIEVFSLPEQYRLDLSTGAKKKATHPITSSLTRQKFPISEKLSKPTTLFKQKDGNAQIANAETDADTPAPVPQEQITNDAAQNSETPPLLTLSDIGLNGLNVNKKPEPTNEETPAASSPIINITQEPARPDTDHTKSGKGIPAVPRLNGTHPPNGQSERNHPAHQDILFLLPVNHRQPLLPSLAKTVKKRRTMRQKNPTSECL